MIAKLVGFSIRGGDDVPREAPILDKFPWLERRVLTDVPGVRVFVWGHGKYDAFIHRASDGALWLLATSNTTPSWPDIVAGGAVEGAFVLVRITSSRIDIWNDWTGLTKTFMWSRAGRWGATTLEPLAVDAANVTSDDVSDTSLYAMMKFGCYFGTSTLYRSISIVAPDSHATITPSNIEQVARKSIRPTDTRWSAGWDDIIEEWAALLETTFRDSLGVAPASTLMLSGGIDSRVIGAVGKSIGHEFRAVSYGNRIWKDGVFAKPIADALGLPLDYHDIPQDYLRKYTQPWCEWFGASMCVHGMYQLPALDALRAAGQLLPITTGFTGDPLEGNQIAGLMAGKGESRFERVSRKFTILDDETIARLMPRLDIAAARADLTRLVEDQYASYEGAEFQRMWLLFQWNRVSQFATYQPTMYEYYFGVIAPFVDTRLANFTLSLPRVALDGRRLFFDLIRRHFPDVAKLPGTYSHPSQTFDFLPPQFGIPLLLTKRYLAKAAVGYVLPEALRRGPLREFAPGPNIFARQALRADGVEALYPLNHLGEGVDRWFDRDAVERHTQEVLASDDVYASGKLWPVQALLHRLSVTR